MMRSLSLPSRRARTSCSILALATVLVVGATPAAAQSFQGNGTVTSGTGTITTGVNTTNISVTTSQTVIDWVPFDNAIANNTAIAFQPALTTANFSGAGNFAVLNRINPADSTRMISMNGTISSVPLGFPGASNGSIYFYTPGGFVLGANSIINVGSLVLSASPITVTGGNFINGASNTVVFGQATRPGAAIVTNAGSQITASAGDAYVAMVAPRVQHGGNINVAGSAALVGAEAATINFSPDGLFDIQVTAGTTSSSGVEVYGDITGPTSTGAGDIHGVYLVAVPKNQAMTMLIGNGADLGFVLANNAFDDNGVIVLSAGHDIVDGQIGAKSAAPGTGTANFWFTGAHATNNLFGEATGTADLYSVGAQPTTLFNNDVTVHAAQFVRMGVSGVGTSLAVGGDVSLSSDRIGGVGQSVTAGEASIYAYNSGALSIAGSTTLSADGRGGDASSGTAGSGTGGYVSVGSQSGGSITLASLSITADGQGGNALAAGANGGAGTGGQIWVSTDGLNSLLTISNGLTASALGQGGSGSGIDCVTCNGNGGSGVGGTASLVSNAQMTITGSADLSANGIGGSAGSGALAGNGTGGAAGVNLVNNALLTINGNLNLHADGSGGTGDSQGGTGTGGIANIDSNFGPSSSGSTLTVNGDTNVIADGYGGSANGVSGTGGYAIGGDAFMGDSTNTYAFNGSLIVSASGHGGDVESGTGGGAEGGVAALGGSGANIHITNAVTIAADATGGSGEVGGDAFGGFARIVSRNIQIDGSAFVTANGDGGYGYNGDGGDGYGGLVRLTAQAGDVNFNSSVFANADGNGGGSANAGSTSGDGHGGTVIIRALANGNLNIAGTLFASSAADGGDSDTGAGGDAFGGDIRIYADGIGSTLTFSGATTVTSNAFGGGSATGTGGTGYGGDIDIYAQNGGTLLFGGDLTARADGRGGYGDAIGGYGEGGTLSIFSLASLQINGALIATARGFGGDVNDGSAGAGKGGLVEVYAENGTLTAVGAAVLSTLGFGGAADFAGSSAGNGQGGQTNLTARAGGTLGFQGALTVAANGVGGQIFGAGVAGGNGTGGDVRVQATAANATITVGGNALLVANGFASVSGGDCDCGAIGGTGTGGTVWADARGAASASLNFQADLTLRANGVGGDGDAGAAGGAQGGETLLKSTEGSMITVGGNAILNSNALGGYSFNFNEAGGNAIGGVARIETFGTNGVGGTIDIGGNATVTADGRGGRADGALSGPGGNGTGGSARIITTLGTITIGSSETGGNATVTANGIGGTSDGGIGGNGFGGSIAGILAINGNLNIAGFASVSGSGFGGNGRTGGNGFGSDFGAEFQTLSDGAQIFARNGNIVIGGGASVAATGVGGNGANGGNGGNGSGGLARILAQNGDLGPSTITIVSGSREGSGIARVYLDGTGGNGGNGVSGNAGGNGGNGGTGTGGYGGIFAAAGNGTVTITNAFGYSRGTGGNGGNGASGAGGNGGTGGNGVGGSINIGTISGGNEQALGFNNGVGNYGTITANANAVGGRGGNGNFGATNGNGGNGGDATGGAAVLLVRGSTVNVVSTTLTANATGGNAGFGYVPVVGTPGITGIGGNATVGGTDRGIGVEVTDRYLIPAQRGTLNAGSINGTAIATGGIGIPNGNSQNLGGSTVTFRNADGNIGSLNFLIQTGINASNPGVDSISVIDGDVTVSGAFRFITSGNLSLFANNGDMHAGSLTLSARNFVFDPVSDPPSDRGTYFADTSTITTGNNFVTSANLDIGGDLSIVAPGLINAQQFTIGGDLDLWAQNGGITATVIDVDGRADLTASGSILINSALAGFFHAEAGGSFTSGNITSDTNIQIDTGTNMTLGNLIAGLNVDLGSSQAIRLNSGGSIVMGNATAKGGIDFDAEGSVTGGNLTSGLSVGGNANLAISLGAISAGLINSQGFPTNQQGFSVGITSATSITTGNVAGAYSVGFATLGPITTGTINAGADFLVMASGNMSFGPITAVGRVYLADSSMYIAAGGGGDGEDGDNFDPEAVFGATPVASNGSIVVNGPISAGSLQAAAGTSFTSGNINATGLISVTAKIASITTGSITNTGNTGLAAGTSINVGAINSGAGAVSLIAGSAYIAGDVVDAGSITTVSSGNTTFGNLDAGGNIYQRAGGTLTDGDVNAGGYIDIRSTGAMALGDLVAGDYIDLRSNNAIGLLTANAGETINFQTLGTLTGLTINAGNSVLGQAMGGIQLGNITAGIIDPSSVPGANYRVGLASDGAITTGAINALGNIGFGTPLNVTTGNLTSGGGIMALIGGNASFGAMTTGSGGYVYLGHYSMSPLGGAFATFNRAPILAQFPAATGGSIIINGPVTTGNFRASAGTTFTSGEIIADNQVALSSGGAMLLQDVTAGTSLRLTSGATINGGDLTAGTLVRVSAIGAVNVGDITIDGGIQVADVGPGSPVEVFGASIITGNISTDGYVGLYTPSSLTVGTINAGHDVIALVGTNAGFGAINTPERFFLGGYSMFAGLNGGETFSPALVFGATKAKTGGSATFGGSSTANSFQAYVGTDTTLQSLQTGSFALIDTGGMFTLNGTLGGNSRVISNDIALGATSAINGEVHLTSRNATQTLIGDGLDTLGQGYRLSDAEADRINAVFTIAADTAYGAAAKMIIGDLSINVAASSGRNLEYGFGTVNGNADNPSVGSIRVVGDVTFTGLDQFDRVDFDTNLFQLDAATGSIALFSTGTTLGGTLGLFAPRVWVASGAILAKLEANSTYSGYITELNAPAAVQRPEGVLRAASFDIDSGEEQFQSFLVQNTGTVATPAGFVLTDSDLSGDGGSDDPPGSINLVINGQIITQAGTLTGIAVRDLLVAGAVDTASAVAGSTINGCVLVGPCVAPPPPKIDTPARTDVQLSDNSGLGDGLFGNEPDIAGESDGDSSSPIAAPNPLFDSRPLGTSDDVDDPVSGAGNPSLYGANSEEDADVEVCDGNKDKKCKTNAKGDGK